MHTKKAKTDLRRLAQEIPNKGVWKARWADTQKFLQALHIDPSRSCQDPLHALDTQILHLRGKSTDDPLMRSAFSFREGIRQRPKLQKASELLFKNCFYSQAVYPSAIANQVHWELKRQLEFAPERYPLLPRVYQNWREEKKTYRKRLDRDFIGYRNFVFDLDQANWDWPNLARRIRKLGLWEFLAAVVETSPRKFHVYFRMDQILPNPDWLGPAGHPLWPQALGARGSSPLNIWWSSPAPDPGRYQLYRDLWEFLNRELRGDPAVRDGLRLLQLPGFRNPKVPEFFARTVFANPNSWSLTPEILTRLHPNFRTVKPPRPAAPAPQARRVPREFPPRRDWSPAALKKMFPRCHPPDALDIREKFQYSLLRWAFIASRVAGESTDQFWQEIVLPYFEAREFNSKDTNWAPRAERQFRRCLNSLGTQNPRPNQSGPNFAPLPERIEKLLRERGATTAQILRLTPSMHELLRRSCGQRQTYSNGENFALVHFPLEELRRRKFPGDLTAHRRLLERFGFLVTSYSYSPRALHGGLGIAKTIEFSIERDFRARPAEFVRATPPTPPPPFRLTPRLFRRFLAGDNRSPEMLIELQRLQSEFAGEEFFRGFAAVPAPELRERYRAALKVAPKLPESGVHEEFPFLGQVQRSEISRGILVQLVQSVPALSQALYSSKSENLPAPPGSRWGPSPPSSPLH